MSKSRTIVVSIAAVLATVLAIVLVQDITSTRSPQAGQSSPIPQPPIAVMNTKSSPDAGQPYNYLDYEGDPVSPDRIILWCDAGQTALVIPTKGMKPGNPEDFNDQSGSREINVRAGEHVAYNLVLVKQKNGGVEFRVWYDDTKVTADSDGQETLSSRIAIRNFARVPLEKTYSVGY